MSGTKPTRYYHAHGRMIMKNMQMDAAKVRQYVAAKYPPHWLRLSPWLARGSRGS